MGWHPEHPGEYVVTRPTTLPPMRLHFPQVGWRDTPPIELRSGDSIVLGERGEIVKVIRRGPILRKLRMAAVRTLRLEKGPFRLAPPRDNSSHG